jgi:hypothetical protein
MVLAQRINKITPLARAILVIAVVAAFVTGVTFAALQDTATLSNNTINSDVDGLLVDSDGDESFGTTDEGFAFNNIAPGGTSDPMAFQLKNDTDGPLVVHVQVTGESALPAGVDPDDITFIFDLPGGGTDDVSATWAEIIPTDGVNLFDNLGAGVSADLTVKVHIDSSVTDEVSIEPFNFTFGTPDTVEEAL